MNTMKRYNIINRLLLLSLLTVSLLLPGCYSDFDNPEVKKIYTDADFDGATIISVKQLKQLFYDNYGSGSDALGKSYTVTDNYVIKGKVISSDKDGNIYRTMYIQDETGAIEVKLGVTTSYNIFPVGQIVYVKCRNLVIGNYRYMLSLGIESTDASYANGYISVWPLINTVVFPGERTKLTSADTVIVKDYRYLQNNELDLLGRLVRIEGLTSYFGTWSGDVYPSFLEQVDDVYTTYGFEQVIKEWNDYLNGKTKVEPKSPRPGNLNAPTYAYNYDNNKYYGTALFKFGSTSSTLEFQNLLVRSSGYSKFALEPIPANGSKVNITAIFTKYSAKSGRYIKYQLLLNSDDDIIEVK